MSELYQVAESIADRWYFVKKNIVCTSQTPLDYLKYRFLRPLLKLYNQLLVLQYGKYKPWLSPASIRILTEFLNKSMTALEYGSGRSTIYFAKRVKKLICIEHHPEWFELVSRELIKNEINNVEYIKISSQLPESKKEIEKRYKKEFHNENDVYADYFERINDFPDLFFDFILIDGRARVECSSRAIPKLKNGGIFILDNSERRRYKPVHAMLSKWKKVETTSGLTNTTIWFKP